MQALDNEQKEGTGSLKCSSYPAKSILFLDDFQYFPAPAPWGRTGFAAGNIIITAEGIGGVPVFRLFYMIPS
jgi:hypothetical protein